MSRLSHRHNSYDGYRNSSKTFIVLCLILFCPVLVTDFMISAGFVPISYVIFYFIIWVEPVLLIHLLQCTLYIVLFYGFEKMIFSYLPEKPKLFFSVSILLFSLLILLSSRSVYVDIDQNSDDRKNIYTLYSDQIEFRKEMQMYEKQREVAEKRRKRLEADRLNNSK